MAYSIAESWLTAVYTAWVSYNRTMFEKVLCACILYCCIASMLHLPQYNCSGGPGAGGEYVVQAGFGWTNAVALQLMNKYPSLVLTEASSLAWLAALTVPLAVLVGMVILCACWCRWLYRNGEQRYWARVRNEQHLHSSGDTQKLDRGTVLENIYIEDEEDWIESRLTGNNVSYCEVEV